MMTTRQLLIRSAARLLDEGGPSAVTLRAVGALAGVSHNAPYKHFADKQDLLAAVAAGELRALTRAMKSAAARRTSATGKVEASAIAYVRWAQAHPARFKLTFGSWEGEHDELADAAATAVESMNKGVSFAASQGALRGDPEQSAALIWALGHGAVDLSLSGHLGKRSRAITPERLVKLLIQTLSESEPPQR
jgi:AcrR family transcriptional regulator